MGKLIKWFVILVILLGIMLTAYAYLGPYFGVDFAPSQTPIRVPVDLNAS
jgi:hypothetical protein